GDDALRAFLTTAPLGKLEVLNLAGAGASDEALKVLAGSTALGELRELDLSSNVFGGSGLALLAAAPLGRPAGVRDTRTGRGTGRPQTPARLRPAVPADRTAAVRQRTGGERPERIARFALLRATADSRHRQPSLRRPCGGGRGPGGSAAWTDLPGVSLQQPQR